MRVGKYTTAVVCTTHSEVLKRGWQLKQRVLVYSGNRRKTADFSSSFSYGDGLQIAIGGLGGP